MGKSEENSMLALASCLLTCVVVFLNLAVVVVLAQSKIRQNARNFIWMVQFACGLARCLIDGVTIADFYFHGSYSVPALCPIRSLSVTVFGHCSELLIMLLIVEKFMCYCHPTDTLRLYGRKKYVYFFVMASFTYCIVWAMLPFFGVGTFQAKINNMCILQNYANPWRVKAFALCSTIALVIAPLVAALICIFLAHAKYRSNEFRRNVAELSIIQHMRQSRVSMDREWFEIRFLLVILLLYVVMWLPCYVTHFPAAFDHRLSQRIVATSAACRQLSSLVPLMFLHRNADFWRASRKLCHKVRAHVSRLKLRHNRVGVSNVNVFHMLRLSTELPMNIALCVSISDITVETVGSKDEK